MNMMNILRGTSFALAIGFTATAAHAQAADDFRIDDAWKAALEGNEGILTEKQQAVITGIAYAASAALLCDGIDIDADKVAAATTAVLAEVDLGHVSLDETITLTEADISPALEAAMQAAKAPAGSRPVLPGIGRSGVIFQVPLRRRASIDGSCRARASPSATACPATSSTP